MQAISERLKSPRLIKALKDSIGITGFQRGVRDARESGTGSRSEQVVGGLAIGIPQFLTPSFYGEFYPETSEKRIISTRNVLIAAAIDLGMIGAVVGLAAVIGPEVAVGTKIVYNSSASAITDRVKAATSRLHSS